MPAFPKIYGHVRQDTCMDIAVYLLVHLKYPDILLLLNVPSQRELKIDAVLLEKSSNCRFALLAFPFCL